VNPESFARMKEILLRAADLPPTERAAFLDEACSDDPDLRREIDAVLAHDQEGHHILDPGALLARMDVTAPIDWIGRTVARYKIVERLGGGGMGVVFRAQDIALGRQVALKCLSADLVADPDCRRRFLHEGRAASKVSHPNIVQVFEAFEAEGYPWLALQYVAGRDLGVLLADRGPLPVETILRYGEDVASALKVAHAHGILHRDIKPSNILIDSEDRALVGDFGLARIQQAEETAGGRTSTTITPPGAVIGTPRYMSPEQALGRPVDERSDIFSFGAVLYEMCTGAPAFAQSSQGSLSDAIIHREPKPIAQFTYEVPEDLERIIRKSMSKLPEERYQDGGELLVDIRAARKKHEFRVYAETHPGTSAPVTRHRSLRSLLWIIPFAAMALLLLAREITERRNRQIPVAEPVHVTSANGWEGQPAISPDGGRVAYAASVDGNCDVYVVDAHGGPPIRLTDEPGVDSQPAWFPDGGSLLFASDRSGQVSIWRTGQFGGGATLLVPDAEQPVVSPDGAWVAFTRAASGSDARIGKAPIADPNRVVMLTDDRGGLWAHEHPAWSPDGRTICYATRHGLWEVPASGGVARRMSADADLVQDPVWSGNRRHIYFTSYRDGTVALWRIDPGGGPSQRVTLGDSRQCQPSLSADCRRLVYATQGESRTLVFSDQMTSQETTVRALSDAEEPALSPDGKFLAFVSTRGGKRLDVGLQPLDRGLPSGGPHPLTAGPGEAHHPTVSPDGRWIAYYQVIGEERDLWTIPVRGGSAIRLTDDPATDMEPAWSPDGRWLAFTSERGGRSRIWVMGVDGGRPSGSPRFVEDEPIVGLGPVWSPDGGTIAFVGSDSTGNDVWIVPTNENGSPRRLTTGANVTRVCWDAAHGDLVACGTWGARQFGFRRMRSPQWVPVPLDHPVEAGPESSIPMFDVSTDGRTLVLTREEVNGDIWLLEARKGTY
jgi:eukaryotic-like serine/threonine-protein kinase